jgi:hypothetical protein
VPSSSEKTSSKSDPAKGNKTSEVEAALPVSPRSPTSQNAVHGVKSKIGSLDNARHTPGGGKVKIVTHKIDLSSVTSKCGSKDNMQHTPRGGDKKIESKKLEWKAESKVGSLDNATHKPGGGDKKIESKKLEWNVTAKVGSLENAEHQPGGGTKKSGSVSSDKQDTDSQVASVPSSNHSIADKPSELQSVTAAE